jgi:hypothetical protein
LRAVLTWLLAKQYNARCVCKHEAMHMFYKWVYTQFVPNNFQQSLTSNSHALHYCNGACAQSGWLSTEFFPTLISLLLS